MLILAIETTDKAGSVALLNDTTVLAEHELDTNLRSAQSLAPGIAQILETASRRPNEVQLVAVAVGPGSFTGLRVGVTTAKMFAYAVNAAVLGVNALEAIARQANVATPKLWAVMDAQRNELFAGLFSRNSQGEWSAAGETQLIANDTWLAGINSETAVTGPGLLKLTARIPAIVPQAERHLWTPRAPTVGKIAHEQYTAGARDDVFQLVPHYFRRSAAEEKQLAQKAATSQ